MSIKVAKQAACVEVLEAWIEHDDAADSVDALGRLFDASPSNVSDLVRRIAQRHDDVSKGVLHARLTRALAAIDRNAEYFRAAPYEPDIRSHLAAHHAFEALLEGLAAPAGARANGIDPVTATIREAALTESLPEFLAEATCEAATREPVAVPLALCTAELAGIVGKVYALVCKASGPALADKTLARALESVEREQPGFDPRRLL